MSIKITTLRNKCTFLLMPRNKRRDMTIELLNFDSGSTIRVCYPLIYLHGACKSSSARTISCQVVNIDQSLNNGEARENENKGDIYTFHGHNGDRENENGRQIQKSESFKKTNNNEDSRKIENHQIQHQDRIDTENFISKNNNQAARKEVNIHSDIETLHSKWPLVEGEFKVLARLCEGLNRLLFTCQPDRDFLQITVQYTKSGNKRKILPIYVVCKNSDGCFQLPLKKTARNERYKIADEATEILKKEPKEQYKVTEATPDVSETGNNKDLNRQYKVAKDRCDVAEAVLKIRLNARLMQTFFAESLYEHGFDRKTFDFVEDQNEKGEVRVEIFHSELEFEQTKEMTPDQLYKYFHRELTSKFGKETYKLLVFMSCTRYHPPSQTLVHPRANEFSVERIMSYVKGHAALGGGCMALFGSGSFFTWASHLSELHQKFTDETKVDRTTTFDDSCGRGTYWANYSTTLGAAIHELGHCFDLAHTPHGIMARGHDDMNCFYTPVAGRTAACSYGATTKYKGAHWHRASAVILNHHKWLNPSNAVTCHPSQYTGPTLRLQPDQFGPVGKPNKSTEFNSRSWLCENNLTTLACLVVFWDRYVRGVQFIGANIQSKCSDELCSPVYGTIGDDITIKTEFRLDHPAERIESICVRAGAWIDTLQICTNQKTSRFMGGGGGDATCFKLPETESQPSVFGTASLQFVCSFGVKIESREMNENLHSDLGIPLVEFRDAEGRIQNHVEFDSPLQKVKLRDHVTAGNVCGMAIDTLGNILNFKVP